MMENKADINRARFRLRYCDATVALMGLLVALGGVFRAEISWLLTGN